MEYSVSVSGVELERRNDFTNLARILFLYNTEGIQRKEDAGEYSLT